MSAAPRLLSARFFKLNSRTRLTTASAMTLLLVLIKCGNALSFCSQIPWTLTREDAGCNSINVDTWTCWETANHGLVLHHASLSIHETRCCAVILLDSATVYFHCKGGTLVARHMSIIEDCRCAACTGKHNTVELTV